MDIEVYVEEQKMPILYCTDAHGDLDLRCLQKGPFRMLDIIMFSCGETRKIYRYLPLSRTMTVIFTMHLGQFCRNNKT